MQLRMQGASIRRSSASISLVIGLIKEQRYPEVMISFRTRVQSVVSRVYLAKNIPEETEGCGEGQVALGRGVTLSICTRRVAQTGTFDYSLIDIL